MQHVVPNNVARCCVEALQAFGQALSTKRQTNCSIEYQVRYSSKMYKIRRIYANNAVAGDKPIRNDFYDLISFMYLLINRRSHDALTRFFHLDIVLPCCKTETNNINFLY